MPYTSAAAFLEVPDVEKFEASAQKPIYILSSERAELRCDVCRLGIKDFAFTCMNCPSHVLCDGCCQKHNPKHVFQVKQTL